MADFDHIGLQKAILWEQAKGLLRAVAAASGMSSSVTPRSPDWEEVSRRVEEFIAEFENHGMHE